MLLAARIVAQAPEENGNAVEMKGPMSKARFHQICGHAGTHLMQATAKYYGVELSGTVQKCVSCSLEKIRQKNIPKENENKSKIPGERMYLDISSMRTASLGGRKHWSMLVDEATHYKKSFFLRKKSDQEDEVAVWLLGLKTKYNIVVRFIRCDNSQENQSLERRLDQDGMGIIFEYTARGTPQQNALVERAFATVMGRGRAMMNFAGFTRSKRQQLWCEAAQTATMVDNVLVQTEGKAPPFKRFYNEDAKYAKYLRTFGEMAVVADTENKTGRTKIDPRGKMSLLLGYTTKHAGDVYRFLNMETQRVVHSRDVQWLDKNWAQFYRVPQQHQEDAQINPWQGIELVDDDANEDEQGPQPQEQAVPEQVEEEDVPEIQERRVSFESPVASRTRSQTAPVASRTRSSLGAEDLASFASVSHGNNLQEWLQEVAFVTATMSDPNEPATFQEAWWHPEAEARAKWREAIRLEFKKMIAMGVWRKVGKEDVPEGRRLVGCKWVFKIKRNGVYRARLVAKGFSQIPGVDFTESFSPVVNDVTFRVVLTRMLIEDLEAVVVDIDNAFLNGDLDHEIYMQLPDGYKEVIEEDLDKGDCLKLLKAIYGLVQASRQFWKKLVDKLKEGGFKQSEADPCLLYKADQRGMCIIIIYIDDMLIVGTRVTIDEAVAELQKHFQVKDPTGLEDYLGVQIVRSKDRKRAWLGQPSIVKNLELKFGEEVANKQVTLTPGTPGFVGAKMLAEEECIDVEQQGIYRSGVGTLLYLTKHSRPEITNPVRELSKSMDGACPAHMKEMYRVIRYVLSTKEYGLRMVPDRTDAMWHLMALSDSDFATDRETRLSVYGYIVYFCGVPVAWKSKSMRSVVLSTTEAEYVAVSEVVKELRFLYQLLQSMGVDVVVPIQVKVDNVGAIWLANNSSVSERTKHVDCRRHFVRTLQSEGFLDINFVRSSENDSDVMTKNQQAAQFNQAQPKLVYTVDEMEALGEEEDAKS